MLQHYRKLGHAESPALSWHEWAPYEDNFDIHDEEVWEQAIPTLGETHGVTIGAVREAVQTTDPTIFAQEWLNVWPSLVTQNVIDSDKWAKLARQDIQIGSFMIFAVDISPNRDKASIGAAGISGAFTAVEVIESENRIGWVKDRIIQLYEKWKMPFVIDSGAAASSLIGELEEAGVEVIAVNMRQYGQACGSFYDAVEEGTIAHLGDVRLQTAVDNATRRKLGEQWAWSRKSDADITPLVAVTLARFALVNGLTTPQPKAAIH
jgi:phage terminase large subunit-like protein